jgi:hypothetical protein
MAKKKQIKQTQTEAPEKLEEKKKIFPKSLIFGGIFVLLVLGLIGFYSMKRSPNTNKNHQIPPFVTTLGFGNKAAFSTSDRKSQGLILVEGERKYQHPSWKTAGSLSPITRDGKGNTFVAPAPWVDLLKNKPADQNKIYRVDGQSQEMKLFVDLPRDNPQTTENAYGVLGLAFDCDTDSLYATSIFASTRREINGKIYQLDEKGNILSKLNKTDAIGLAVFNSAKGKRLYFGDARTSEIRSIVLDDNGNFSSESKVEISLANLGPRGNDKPRKINFSNNEMVVFGIEFSYNLVAPTEKQETIYRFRYDASQDKWNYIQEPPQIVEENNTSNRLTP